MLKTNPHSARGQALVVMTLALIAIIGGLALIIDGGNAWSQQRITQAANDAISEAGAVVLAEQMVGATEPGIGWDGQVSARMAAVAAANGVTIADAYYTDVCGRLLRPDGTAASGPGTAARVGAGSLPTNSNTNPDCPNAIVGPVDRKSVA